MPTGQVRPPDAPNRVPDALRPRDLSSTVFCLAKEFNYHYYKDDAAISVKLLVRQAQSSFNGTDYIQYRVVSS